VHDLILDGWALEDCTAQLLQRHTHMQTGAGTSGHEGFAVQQQGEWESCDSAGIAVTLFITETAITC
jgi:hypothetical protein